MSIPSGIYYMYKHMLVDTDATMVGITKKQGKYKGEYWIKFLFSIDDPQEGRIPTAPPHIIMLRPKDG